MFLSMANISATYVNVKLQYIDSEFNYDNSEFLLTTYTDFMPSSIDALDIIPIDINRAVESKKSKDVDEAMRMLPFLAQVINSRRLVGHMA